MQQDTDNDRCAPLAKINASNFPSRLKELTKTASIHLPPTQKVFQISRLFFLPAMIQPLYLKMTSSGYHLPISQYKLISTSILLRFHMHIKKEIEIFLVQDQ